MNDLELLDELTAKIARGALPLSAIAGLEREDLDSLCADALHKLDAGMVEEAAALLAGLLVCDQHIAAYWRAYGVALQRLNYFGRAVQAYSAALALEPDIAFVHLYRAEALLLLGDVSGARQDLRRAQQLLTNDADDSSLLVRLQQLQAVLPPVQRAARQSLHPDTMSGEAVLWDPVPSAEYSEAVEYPRAREAPASPLDEQGAAGRASPAGDRSDVPNDRKGAGADAQVCGAGNGAGNGGGNGGVFSSSDDDRPRQFDTAHVSRRAMRDGRTKNKPIRGEDHFERTQRVLPTRQSGTSNWEPEAASSTEKTKGE